MDLRNVLHTDIRSASEPKMLKTLRYLPVSSSGLSTILPAVHPCVGATTSQAEEWGGKFCPLQNSSAPRNASQSLNVCRWLHYLCVMPSRHQKGGKGTHSLWNGYSGQNQPQLISWFVVGCMEKCHHPSSAFQLDTWPPFRFSACGSDQVSS